LILLAVKAYGIYLAVVFVMSMDSFQWFSFQFSAEKGGFPSVFAEN
jgi:hypothetical protein